jgi:hypothetical protein
MSIDSLLSRQLHKIHKQLDPVSHDHQSADYIDPADDLRVESAPEDMQKDRYAHEPQK